MSPKWIAVLNVAMSCLIAPVASHAAAIGATSFEVGAHSVDQVSVCLPAPPGYDCTLDSATPSDDETLAVDELAFDATASAAFGNASQTSTISASRIESSSSVWASTSWSVFQNPGDFFVQLVHPTARSISRLVVPFTLTEPTGYLLAADVRLYGAYWWGAAEPARVTLTGPGGVVAEVWHHVSGPCFDPCDPSVTESLLQSGMLPAGAYTLVAVVDATSAGYAAAIGEFGDGFEGEIDVDLRLGPPVPVFGAGGLVLVVSMILGVGARAARTP